MGRLGCIVGLVLAVLGAAALVLSDDLLGAATIGEETPFVIPAGSTLSG